MDSKNIGAIGMVQDGITRIAKLISSVFKPAIVELDNSIKSIPNITDPYRVNRIIRSKYHSGDYIVIHPVLHHYAFEVDNRYITLGILEVIGAIEALEKHENKKPSN